MPPAVIITIDIEDAVKGPRGTKFLTTVCSSGSELVKTARGRLAAHIPKDAFAHIQRSFNLTLEDSFDGLKKAVLASKKE